MIPNYYKIIIVTIMLVNIQLSAQIKDSVSTQPMKANRYYNAIGFKRIAGPVALSYRHYFKDIVGELNVAPIFGGYIGNLIRTDLFVMYQRNWRYWLQPYAGIGLKVVNFFPSDNVIYHFYSNKPINYDRFSIYPTLIVGIEFIPFKWRLAVFGDANWTAYTSGNAYPLYPFSLNYGIRYLFVKKK